MLEMHALKPDQITLIYFNELFFLIHSSLLKPQETKTFLLKICYQFTFVIYFYLFDIHELYICVTIYTMIYKSKYGLQF
jgi:hypothetical protein